MYFALIVGDDILGDAEYLSEDSLLSKYEENTHGSN